MDSERQQHDVVVFPPSFSDSHRKMVEQMDASVIDKQRVVDAISEKGLTLDVSNGTNPACEISTKTTSVSSISGSLLFVTRVERKVWRERLGDVFDMYKFVYPVEKVGIYGGHFYKEVKKALNREISHDRWIGKKGIRAEVCRIMAERRGTVSGYIKKEFMSKYKRGLLRCCVVDKF